MRGFGGQESLFMFRDPAQVNRQHAMFLRVPSQKVPALLRQATRIRISPSGPLSKPAAYIAHLYPTRAIATHTHPHQAAAVSILQTTVDRNSAEFKENEAQMQELLDQMSELHAKISLGGNQKARDKHISRGKMLPRE